MKKSRSSSVIVIIPTYNEVDNIEEVIHRLRMHAPKAHILVVDDNSTDGTIEAVYRLQKEYIDVLFMLNRPRKEGLGRAYVSGFRYALKYGYTYICEMDADLSHDPADIPRLVEEVKSGHADIAIGSRYVRGISIINWPLMRLILSCFANFYARMVTGMTIRDTTAGFKCIHRHVLEHIALDKISSSGYAFQIEIHYRAWKSGFHLKEINIIFKERDRGVSKMSLRVIGEAIWKVWALKFLFFIKPRQHKDKVKK